MKYILSSIFFVFIIHSGSAQLSLSGRIADQSGESLAFASIFLDAQGYAAVSDENGIYNIDNIEEGEYLITVDFLGYRKYEEIFYIFQDTVFNVVLEGHAFGLDQIEINGTWAKDNYPFAKTDFDADDIEGMNYAQDAPFLLKFTPSVVVNSDAGAGVGYTGIRVRGVDPTRINVTMNGIPLNDSESQSVYWVDLPDIMTSVDEVQIQRGVGTSTNGAGAFGATINLNTNKIQLKSYAKIDGTYGSFNTKKLAVELGTGLLNDKFTLDGRYSIIKSDGYIDRAKSALQSFYFSGAMLSDKQSIRLNIFTGNEITYQAWYGLPVQFIETNRTFNSAGTDYQLEKEPYDNEIDNYKQNHIQLLLKRQLSSKINLDLGLHYTRGKGYYEQFKANQSIADYGLSTNEDRSDLVRRKWLDNYFFGMVYNVNKVFDNSEIILGGALNKYIGRHFGQVDTIFDFPEIPGDYFYYDNEGNKLDFNSYIKYNHQFGLVNAFIDLQYRLVNYSFVGKNDDGEALDQQVLLHFFNPKLGLFLDISDRSKMYSSFSIANREPNRNDYTESSPTSRPESEKLYDTELGYRFLSDKLSFGVNLYYMKYKDHLVLTGKLNDVGDYTKVNVPDSYRGGVEFDLAVRIVNALEIGSALTLSRNKIIAFTEYVDNWDAGGQIAIAHENMAISFSPGVIASTQLKWDVIQSFRESSIHKLVVSLDGKYVGKQYIDNTMNDKASLDPYFYSDLSLSYAFKKGVFKNSSIDFKISNLFNNKYSSNGWVYRFKSAGYNPVADDAYSMNDRGDYYQQLGLFPQATRHYMLRLRLAF